MPPRPIAALYDHGIPAPGPSMLRAIRRHEAPQEADVEADVMAEVGRLMQRWPSLWIQKNEVIHCVPKKDAFACIDEAFRHGPPSPDTMKALLARRMRKVGREGSPDTYGAIEFIHFWIELKRPPWRDPGGRLHPGGSLTPDQIVWHRVAARKREHVAIIDGPEQVEPFLVGVLAWGRRGAPGAA